MEDEEYPEKPNTKRLGILVILLFVVITLWVITVSDLFEEPEEPEGIFVRLILFFKQNTLL
ncbi:MAG: hypothetical protein KJI69_03265 [Patescibacteria group bacterium]|nr:hypothetical protein [Patescibacteria group bacterium]